jgi:hypothetical protein
MKYAMAILVLATARSDWRGVGEMAGSCNAMKIHLIGRLAILAVCLTALGVFCLVFGIIDSNQAARRLGSFLVVLSVILSCLPLLGQFIWAFRKFADCGTGQVSKQCGAFRAESTYKPPLFTWGTLPFPACLSTELAQVPLKSVLSHARTPPTLPQTLITNHSAGRMPRAGKRYGRAE